MKRRNNFLKSMGIVFAILLLLLFCGCNQKGTQESKLSPQPSGGSTVSGTQAGAIFAPSTEFVSADAAGAYTYEKLPLDGYRVHAVLPASGNLVYVVATPCDASGRFLVGADGVIPTQLIREMRLSGKQ